MSIDSIALAGIKKELLDLIAGGKINNIFQVKRYKIVLEIKLSTPQPSFISHLSKNTKIIYLHLSLDPAQMEIYFSTEKNLPQTISTPFLSLLQNKLGGGKILDLIHLNFDRIFSLVIQNQVKFNLTEKLTLTAEFMGKHGNLILINEDNLIEGSLKVITSQVSRYREVRAGRPYLLPPAQHKLNPLKTTKNDFLSLFTSAKEKKTNLLQLLQNNFQGLNLQNLREIICQANISPEENISLLSPEKLDFLWSSWQRTMEKIKNHSFEPTIYLNPSSRKIEGYSLIGSKQFNECEKLSFSQVNSCLQYFFQEKEKEKELLSLKNKIENIICKNLTKLQQKISHYQQDLEVAQNCENFRLRGELIKSNLKDIKKGVSKVTVVNYYSPQQEMITIPLNPQLSPLQNAQYYFKKYRKARDSFHIIAEQLKKTQEKLIQLEQLQALYEQNSGSYPQLINIYNNLSKAGWERKEITNPSKPKKKQNRLQPARYISKEGWEIYVGKNSQQNEFLTMKLASGNDIWLHIKDSPGSHVIIKNKGGKQTPPLSVLLQAAQLAAYYSKIRNEAAVTVIYTLKKYVKKPKNSKVGMVTYSQEKSLFVKINPREIKDLISTSLSE